MDNLTALQALDETISALGKSKEAVEEYEKILKMVSNSAKEGKVSVDIDKYKYEYDIGLYSILCLKRDGFRVRTFETVRCKSYTISWDVF